MIYFLKMLYFLQKVLFNTANRRKYGKIIMKLLTPKISALIIEHN